MSQPSTGHFWQRCTSMTSQPRKSLLHEYSVEFKSSPELPPSVQLATKRKSPAMLRLLLDGLGDGADPAKRFDYGTPEIRADMYRRCTRHRRTKYLRLARTVLAEAASESNKRGLSS